MSYSLLDNCHHHCHHCHYNTDDEINSLITTVNLMKQTIENMKIELSLLKGTTDDLRYKYFETTVRFGGWSTDSTKGPASISAIVGNTTTNVKIGLPASTESTSLIAIDKETHNRMYYSPFACVYISLVGDSTTYVYHKVNGNGSDGIGFAGHFNSSIINGFHYRLSITSDPQNGDGRYKFIWSVPSNNYDRVIDLNIEKTPVYFKFVYV